MTFQELKVREITPETADTITIEFDIPEPLKALFQYRPGQYVTLRLELDGHEIRRSYSMSSAPFENRLAITVKKVAGGKVSTHLHDNLRVGDTLAVAAPEGRFTIKLDPEIRRTFYLFAAGSGITPIFSLAKSVLEQEPMSTVYLLYGSRNEESIIFRNELDALVERYAGQMHVEYMLSQPKKEPGGSSFFGLFKKTTTRWQGKTGRVDVRAANYFLDEYLVQGQEFEVQYFVCGPGDMADSVKATLLGRGIDAKQIHTEHFVNAGHLPGEASAAPDGSTSGGAKLIVHLKGQRIETALVPGMTILDTLVKEKHDPPYSCTAGACATCMAKVIAGKVKMDACYALDDDEVKAGYVLTCQSRPESDVVEISYDM